MKKNIIISFVIILFLILGYALYKISPPPQQRPSAIKFNLENIVPLEKPSEALEEENILGDKSAKNTIVAFEDFQCPACANFEPVLLSLPKELDSTKVVFRHFPLVQIHKNAALAAMASEAAATQGKFWEMSELLYKTQSDWSNLADPAMKFAEIASEAGVADMEKFKNDLFQESQKPKVERDYREALGLGAQGTPTIYYNGKKLELGNIESIKKQIGSK